MSEDLTDYDRKILRMMAGEDVPGLCWGAAMGETVEHLFGRGLLRRALVKSTLTYIISDKGREALASIGA